MTMDDRAAPLSRSADDSLRRTPVLIVGGGPVGLALAVDLGWRGVPCLLVEQTDGAITYPTAESINTRTMEHLRRWGLADRLRNEGFPPDYPRIVRFVTRVMGYELARFPRPSNREQQVQSRDISPEGQIWCPKFWLDPALRDRARQFPCVELRLGWRLAHFEQDAAGVAAQLVEVATGRTQTVRADYLVGCDGGSSTVRRLLGIPLCGTFAEGHNLGVFFRAPTLLATNPHGPASQFFVVNRERRATVATVDGRELWRLTLLVDPAETDRLDVPATIRTVIGADLPIEVLDVRPWAGHRVVAQRYREGRVFLAGDAAHLLWPSGGFGMNTGVGDAVDLAWKLAAVYYGYAGPYLLDSYESERRPIGVRNVEEAAHNKATDIQIPVPPDLEDDTPAGARARREVGAFIERTRRKEWQTLGIQLGYRYDPSPICWPDGTPPPSDDPSVYEPVARPGSRAPHVWLADGRSTLDLFGRGFVLLRLRAPDLDTAPLERAARAVRLPLQVVDLAEPAVAERYERRLVLVRPDGHVAWRADTLPADPMALIDCVRGAVAPRAEDDAG
jgi:2-polyprenyl-6-methoxyphenol hydroxylase-like FAD-dependent oxidoreductase